MSTWAFTARDPAGRVVRGSEFAVDELDLDRRLEERELLLVSARRDQKVRRRRGGSRSLIDFCHHLGTSVEAGVPLLEGLRDLQDGGSSPLAPQLEDLARRVESGQTLSAAMGAHPSLFPEYLLALVGAGEESGKLDVILHELTAHLEWREDLRRKIVAATTYPCIVVIGLVGLIVLLTTVVLPKFLDLFRELGTDLPLVTRALIGLEGFASAHGGHVVLGTVVVVAALVAIVRTESGRLRLDGLVLRLPVVGSIVGMLEMSRLGHNLGLLYAAGIPITRSTELVSSIVQNRVIRGFVAEVPERIARGEGLADAFGRGDLIPIMLLRVIALGERSGTLDASLEHVAGFYDRELPVRIDRALAVLNTVILLALGATLGTVAFGVFIPLYQMMGSLNG